MKITKKGSVASVLATLIMAGPALAWGHYQWSGWHHTTSNPITVVPAPAPSPTPTPKPAPSPTPAPAPAPTPAPTATASSTSSGATRLSIFVGNDPAQVGQFQNWLGRHVDEIELHGDHSSWDAMLSCFGWQAGLFRSLSTDIVWSVPLIPQGATLDAAATGAYDAKYKAMAQQFVSQWPNDKQIMLRVGWEFNGNGYFPWSAVGKAEQYKAAYRHFVAAFRSVSPNRFKFEWTPNVGSVGMDPSTAYPGDDVVDLIGMDFYYDTKWLGTDPNKAWNTMVTQKWGLQWNQDFAAQHHKPTAYDEWGVNSDTAGPYIQQAQKWFSDHHVVYQNYWNSNSAFKGQLSNNQYPNASAAYKTAFGKTAVVGAIAL
ncbi:MAG: glycosyl hydrolase [Sphingomonas sp.]